MNSSLRHFSLLLTTTLLFAVFSFQTSAQTPGEDLVKDFEALAAYEFGMSNAPLLRIKDAVRAAIADHPLSPCRTSRNAYAPHLKRMPLLM